MTANKKIADMKSEMRIPTNTHHLSSEWGVKQNSHDIWLQASTDDRQGPLLLEDNHAREKIMHFDHERIPERVVHARGAGAFGTFTLLESASDVTTAGVLTDIERTTPVFVRFSTVLGSRGSADTVRDVRGFAVKFYTSEGNWDIVGNDIPVFFIQDAMKFPDVIHAGKPEPDTEVPQAQTAHNNFWDFQYLHTESTHMFMWAMSDRGIPRSFRMMQGFGVNTYTLTNARGVRHFVKFHWTPTLGVHSLVWDEALKIGGQDPDFHRRDLYGAIDKGVFPTWRFGIQVCPEGKEDDIEFDILDPTKVWPEEMFPIRYIGEMQLNKNPDEFFTQVEQAAFCTAHVVPGIGFSDDPLLQGRNFSYFDTQITRIGVNWQELPVNRPICPVMNFHRDGQKRHAITKGKINYYPNRDDVIPPASAADGAYMEYPEKIVAMKQRIHSKKFGEHFKQPQTFWNSMSEIEKEHICKALSFELDHCDDQRVYTRMVERLTDISLDLAQAVAEKVGAPTPTKEGKKNHGLKVKGLSQFDFTPEAQGLPTTIASRTVAIIVDNGFNYWEFEAVKRVLGNAGAFVYVIGPGKQPIESFGGKDATADHHFEGARSTLFDAVYIPGGKHVDKLMNQGRVIHWVREAFGHCKPIGATGEGAHLVKKAIGDVEGLNICSGVELVDSYGVVTAGVLGEKQGAAPESLNMVKGARHFLDAFAWNISQHRNFGRELHGLTAKVAY